VGGDVRNGRHQTRYFLTSPTWPIPAVFHYPAIKVGDGKGLVAAAATAMCSHSCCSPQKILFPRHPTNNWGWNDPENSALFLWAQPVYAFLAVGFAIGMGSPFSAPPHPPVGVMLVWEFVGEFIPLHHPRWGRYFLPWLPFLQRLPLSPGNSSRCRPLLGWPVPACTGLVLSIVMVALGRFEVKDLPKGSVNRKVNKKEIVGETPGRRLLHKATCEAFFFNYDWGLYVTI